MPMENIPRTIWWGIDEQTGEPAVFLGRLARFEAQRAARDGLGRGGP